MHDHVRADVAKTTELARRIGVLALADLAPTPDPCDGLTVQEGTSRLRTGSTGPELAFPKPFPQVFERQARRACQQARERRENTTVTTRSGGRCEVVLDGKRCRKAGREVHHLLGGHGQRGRGDSALATHKVHTCVAHHRLMGLRWIEVTWTTPENPMATVRFEQVRGTPEGISGSGRPGSLLTLAPHRSGRAGSAASGSSTDGFATRRRVPAGPGSQAMATAIPKAYLASSAIRCRDVETGPNLGVLAVFPSTGATCRCPLPSTGSRGLNSPASAVL